MQNNNNCKDSQKRLSHQNVTSGLKQCVFLTGNDVTKYIGETSYFNVLLPFEHDLLSFLIDAHLKEIPINYKYLCVCKRQIARKLLEKGYITGITERRHRTGKKPTYITECVICPRRIKEYQLGRLKPYYPEKTLFYCLVFSNGKYRTFEISAHHENDVFEDLSSILQEELISPHAWVFNKLLNITTI